MLAALLLALGPVVPPSDGGWAAAAERLRVAAASDGPAGRAAAAELTAAANDWHDPARYRRCVIAAAALRAVAAGGGPWAEVAGRAIRDRADALLEWEWGRTVFPARPNLMRPETGPPYLLLSLGNADPRYPHPAILFYPPDFEAAALQLRFGGMWRRIGLPPGGPTRAQFVELAASPFLTWVAVDAPGPLDDDWLGPLREHPALEVVNVQDLPITAAGCRMLASAPNLRGINPVRLPRRRRRAAGAGRGAEAGGVPAVADRRDRRRPRRARGARAVAGGLAGGVRCLRRRVPPVAAAGLPEAGPLRHPLRRR